jgi:transcription-repair coupling factor (superfamily II helicase)
VKVLQDCLRGLSDFEEMQKSIQSGKNIVVSGCVDSQKVHMMWGLSEDFPYRVIATYSDKRARELYEDFSFYTKDVLYFPAKDFIFFQADIHGNKLTRERIAVYRRILEAEPVTIITTFDAFMAPCMPLHVMESNVIRLDSDSVVDEKALALKLSRMGYERVPQVESGGQFSVRGGIVDVFDLTEENPYRIELWGDEIDSIRSFDVLSQRSIEQLDEVAVYPATELLLTAKQKDDGLAKIKKEAAQVEKQFREAHEPELAGRIKNQMETLREQLEEFGVLANLDSYIHYFCDETASFPELLSKEETIFFVDEPLHVKEHTDAVELEFRESMENRLEKGYALPGQTDILYPAKKVMAKLQSGYFACISTLDGRTPGIEADKKYYITAKSIQSFHNSFDELCKELKRYKKNKYRVLLVTPSRTRAKRLAEELRDMELSCFYSENTDDTLQEGQIMSVYGQILKGFEYPHLKFAVIAESDIFSSKTVRKKKKKRYEGQKIQDFTDLKVGDYVVHENHGLGVYQGIEKVEIDHVVKDYMKIAYRDGGILYVRATGFDVIQKYAAADARKPKLNKLGTQEWEKTKTKVKGAVSEVAKELVELYAARSHQTGYAYGEDTVWQKEFEEMFPYEETEDQLIAIEATKKDMESTKIMDRLICGDVGFGKTEIAIRAAFKAVQEGKQVVYLVPTTILAKQHYDTFKQRMKDYPVTIEMLSRFRTAAEQRHTIEELKKGMVDIVIGTHRVLSKDVAFKDLGLLIIDEEQRFGVTHKEKIKQLKNNVDVLTLTATPIPRTLHMSLVGIRDMSVLEEAPNDRMPIQTYVMEYNEEMVREAINRELARNGQVYYVYNRVDSIAEVTAAVQALVPDAVVAFAHGQMKETDLEKILYDFINGEIDVLVATTIIETGIDIPNVNTMIIHDSDSMGLSQLYQLRGRVGRSNRNAYAFLMYRRNKVLKEVAEKRLAAIKEFTDLGSGFKIAMKDLEIRGAGNLLGRMQHGHMEAVGYDLYCKMLNEAVKKLKGIDVKESFQTTIDLDINAFIPAEYILNEFQKLDIYKRIAGIENDEECEDMKSELLDRFGTIPSAVENLLQISLIRARAHRMYVEEIKGKKDGISIILNTQADIRAENIPLVLEEMGTKLKFTMKNIPTFSYKLYPTGFDKKDEEMLLETTAGLIACMEKHLSK